MAFRRTQKTVGFKEVERSASFTSGWGLSTAKIKKTKQNKKQNWRPFCFCVWGCVGVCVCVCFPKPCGGTNKLAQLSFKSFVSSYFKILPPRSEWSFNRIFCCLWNDTPFSRTYCIIQRTWMVSFKSILTRQQVYQSMRLQGIASSTIIDVGKLTRWPTENSRICDSRGRS